MAQLNTNMGRKLYICSDPQNEDLTATEFAALTWTEVKFVVSIGETGMRENILNLDTMDTKVTQKQKGIANAGDPDIELGYSATDPGQAAMRAAAETRSAYAFKFEYDDVLTPSTGTPTTVYNRGVIGGPATPNGAAEDFQLSVFTLGLNQREIIVPAT